MFNDKMLESNLIIEPQKEKNIKNFIDKLLNHIIPNSTQN